MKEIITRAVSGALYVALLLSSMFYSPLAFYVVISIFSVLALWEFLQLIDFKRYAFVFLLIGAIILLYFNHIPQKGIDLILFVAISTNILVTVLLFRKEKKPFSTIEKTTLVCFYLIGSSIFIPILVGNNTNVNPYAVMIFYVSIWSNNSFAYLVGSQFGKHKLFPSISPKKSWEGFFGGMIAVFIVLYIFEHTRPFFDFHWMSLAILIPILATLGDFVQSYFKRRANVKDSGSLLPGHGGFYDRMDSVIYCAPFYYLFLKFI